MAFCRHCGAQLAAQVSFCTSCGQALAVTTPAAQLASPPSGQQEAGTFFPLLVAAILCFAFAGLLGCVGLYQMFAGISAESTSRALDGVFCELGALYYIFLGVGILRRHPKAYEWGVGGNVLNALLGVVLLIWLKEWFYVFLLPFEIGIAVTLIVNKRQFGKRSAAKVTPAISDLEARASAIYGTEQRGDQQNRADIAAPAPDAARRAEEAPAASERLPPTVAADALAMVETRRTSRVSVATSVLGACAVLAAVGWLIYSRSRTGDSHSPEAFSAGGRIRAQASPEVEQTTVPQSQASQPKFPDNVEPGAAQEQAETARRRGAEAVETQGALADAEADKRRAEQEDADLTAKRVAEERRKQVEAEAAELRRQTAEKQRGAKMAEIARAKHVTMKGPLQYCADLTGSDRYLSAGTRAILSVRVGPYDSHVPSRNDSFVVVRREDLVDLTGARDLQDLCENHVADHPVIAVDAWECGEEAEVRALPEEFRSTGARRVRHRIPCAARIELLAQQTAEDREKQVGVETVGSGQPTFIAPSHRQLLSDKNKKALERLRDKQKEQQRPD